MPFQKGQSGNPKGRPPRPKSKKLPVREELLRLGFNPVVVLVNLANDVSQDADLRLRATIELARFSLTRPRDTPTIQATGTLAEKATAVLDAVLGGEIAPADAKSILSGMLDAAQLESATENKKAIEELKSDHNK